MLKFKQQKVTKIINTTHQKLYEEGTYITEFDRIDITENKFNGETINTYSIIFKMSPTWKKDSPIEYARTVKDDSSDKLIESVFKMVQFIVEATGGTWDTSKEHSIEELTDTRGKKFLANLRYNEYQGRTYLNMNKITEYTPKK